MIFCETHVCYIVVFVIGFFSVSLFTLVLHCCHDWYLCIGTACTECSPVTVFDHNSETNKSRRDFSDMVHLEPSAELECYCRRLY